MTTLALPVVDRTHFKAQFEADLFAAPAIHTLQINIGYVCNLACRHCHVESSPARTGAEENMSEVTARRVVAWAFDQPSITTVDFTGGSPEMNPNFCWMVENLHKRGIHIIDRCNPTIIEHVDKKSGVNYKWIPEFLAANKVEVVASLPCYSKDNVDHQRGRGSYDDSVKGLLALNAAGYGRDDNLRLNLVYNPDGPTLPPPQGTLEQDYRRELRKKFGIVFNELWTITNMPIKRWRHELERDGQLQTYMNTLIDAYNPATVEGLMCRHQINIDPQGYVYDCDFNQALGMPIPGHERSVVWELSAEQLANRAIATDDHCYGCTAGSGSSCGGAIT